MWIKRFRPGAPTVTVKLVPVFTSEELSALRRAGQGRSFADRRDAAVLAVFEAADIRLSELAGFARGGRGPEPGALKQLGQAGQQQHRVFGDHHRGRPGPAVPGSPVAGPTL
jgi:hypothetical protein